MGQAGKMAAMKRLTPDEPRQKTSIIPMQENCGGLSGSRLPGVRRATGSPASIARRLALLLPMLLVCLFTSCSRSFVLETAVDEDEGIRRGSPVMLDEKGVGHVVRVEEEAGRLIAEFEITDRNAREKLVENLVRVKSKNSGRIDLRTTLVREGARPLNRGDHVPAIHVYEERVHHYSRAVNWTLLGTLLATVALVLKRMTSFMGLMLQFACIAAASVLSYFAVPYVTPHAAKWLDHFESGESHSTEEIEERLVAFWMKQSADSPGQDVVRESTGPVQVPAEADDAHGWSAKPSPQVAAWAICFVTSYLGLNLLLRFGFRPRGAH